MRHLRSSFKQVRKNSSIIIKGCMGIAFLICLLVPASTAFAATNSAHTSQSSSIASYDSDKVACTNLSSQAAYVHCITPTAKSFCGPNQWYGPVSDGKTMTEWTRSYGTQHCVTVTWNTASYVINNSCHASVYIPIHKATAPISYQFHYGSKIATSRTIYQANYAGEFVDLDLGGTKNALTSITMQDDNYQSRNSEIGWGTQAKYSLKITCSR